MSKPFIEELQDFFHEYINNIDFNELSLQHGETADELSKQCNLLKPLLSKDGQEILNNFDNAYGNLLILEVQIAYKKGFAEGLKFLFFFLLHNGGNP